MVLFRNSLQSGLYGSNENEMVFVVELRSVAVLIGHGEKLLLN